MFNLVLYLADIFNPRVYHLAQISENIEDPSKIISDITVSKVIQGLLVIVITYAGLWLVNQLINWLSEKVSLKYRLKVKQSLPFLRAFITGFAIFILLDLYLKLSPNNLLAITGTAAVALGFAFKDYVSSLIAGIIALFESPYQVGDRIKIDDHYGEIIDYSLRGILIQTPDDNTVTIPHNKIWTEPISNANKGSIEAQTVIHFYLAHNIDVERVIRILYQVAYTSKYTQLELPILVVMEEKPWGSHFKLKCYPIDARDEFIYQTDLTQRAKKVFAQENIPYPVLPVAFTDKKSS